MAVTLLFAMSSSATLHVPIPRFAYIVGCDGIVDQIDMIRNVRIRTVDVGSRLPIQHIQANSTFDECPIGHAVYVPKEAAFYGIVPDRYNDPHNVSAFRFTVPGLVWKRAFYIGPYDGFGDTSLALVPSGKVRVVRPEERPPQFIDIKTFRLESSITSYSIIEISDHNYLAVIRNDKDHTIMTVANSKIRKSIILNQLINSTDKTSHLVPGGSLVYIEESNYVSENGQAETVKKTGRAALYDARNGKRLQMFVDSRIASMRFVAISPSGKVIYHNKREYFLLDLGHVFPDEKVVTQPKTQADAVFYTNR